MKRSPLERKTPLAAGSPLVSRSELRRTELVRGAGLQPGKGLDRGSKPMKTGRPSEAPFRNEVMDGRGRVCRACGSTVWVQAAHIVGKGQGGPTRVENGLPLCQVCHTAYDGYRLQLRYEWLDPDQLDWLARERLAGWDTDGQPFGPHCRRFAPMTPGQIARRHDRTKGTTA